MTQRVILLGGGGHGIVVAGLAAACSMHIQGVVDPDPEVARRFAGAEWMGGEDAAVLLYAPDAVLLLNGVGANRPATVRRRVYEALHGRGYLFPTLVHPTAWVAPGVDLADGAQIMAGAMIQPETRVGSNSIINTRASIDHECRIGAHVHIAPGATLCGNVVVEDGAMVGAGAVVTPGIYIGTGAMVGAGAAVTKNVPAGVTVRGVPARPSS